MAGPGIYYDSLDGDPFRVTEADQALVAPLGTHDDISDEDQRASLARWLKHIMRGQGIPDHALPYGRWDAYQDEGHFQCGIADCPEGQYCCAAEHQIVTRPASEEFDSVFIRLHTEVFPESMWDLEVVTRYHDGRNLDQAAVQLAEGGEYTVDQCLTDLGVLLAVFRVFVQQGRL